MASPQNLITEPKTVIASSSRAPEPAQGNRAIGRACPLKIIFCVDLSREMDEKFQGTSGVGIKSTLGVDISRIQLTKRLLMRHINLKRMFGNHEFAIVILNEKAVWHMDFSSDEMLLDMVISELCTTGHYTKFDTTSLFETISQHVKGIDPKEDFMVQVILIYGRSGVLPDPIDEKVLAAVYKDSRIRLDVIYLHDKKNATNCPQLVYDRLTDLENPLDRSYFFEVTRHAKRYTLAMTQLLGHPRQRAMQEETSFILDEDVTVDLVDDED